LLAGKVRRAASADRPWRRGFHGVMGMNARSDISSAVPRPRQRKPAVRRAELLQAAERLFLERGIDGASIDDVAAAAGVAKGTVYLYFASKDELVAAVRERFAEAMAEHIAARVAQCAADDWPGKLSAWAEAAVSTSLDALDAHDALFHGARLHPRRYTPEHENAGIANLAALLAAGQAHGAWLVEDPAMLAAALFHAFHGAVDYAIATQPDVDRARLLRSLRALFLAAVASNRP
jgi:AcrR family transcriptional regulator